MFVKIVKFEYIDDETGCKTLYESLYECARVTTRKVERKLGQSGEVVMDLLLEMEGHTGEFIGVQIERKAHAVFIMNDSGKTIDSYSWNNKQH